MKPVKDLPPIAPAVLHQRRERVFLILAGLFLGTLAMLNILGISRFLVLASWGDVDGQTVFQWGVPNFDKDAWIFAVAVGVLPYPMTFLCTDLISEFYGLHRANFVVWVGLMLNLWVMFILWAGAFAGIRPTMHRRVPEHPRVRRRRRRYRETGWTFSIRTLAFGAVTASMIAYLAAQFVDVYVFHFWKRLTQGKHLWLRNNGSTMVSQMVDTVAVILVTHFYAHALPLPPEGRSLALHLSLFIATGYAFKFVAALLDTPVIYVAVYFLKDYLRIDPTSEHAADDEEVQMYSGNSP
ncbi:MAG: queuosine precursor transporter [Phycisphaerales bacterium]